MLELKSKSGSNDGGHNFFSKFPTAIPDNNSEIGAGGKRTPKLKKRLKLLKNARLATLLQKNEAAIMPSQVDEIVPIIPKAVTKILEKLNQSSPDIKKDKERDKLINKKLMNSLFLSKIDTEELKAVIDHGEEKLVPLGAKKETKGTTAIVQGENFISFRYQLEEMTINKETPIKKPSEVMKNPFDQPTFLPTLSQNSLHSPSKMEKSSNYFGAQARLEFFDHYKKMDNMKYTIHPSSSDIISYAPSSSVSIGEMSQSTPRHLSDSRSFLSSSIHSSNHITPDKIEADLISKYTSNSVNHFEDKFFNQLQNLASNKLTMQALDKEILSYEGFQSAKTNSLTLSSSSSSISSFSSSINRRKLKPIPMFSMKTTHELDKLKDLQLNTTSLHSRHHDDTEMMSSIQDEVYSPRTIYISGCIRDGLCPLPNLILRKHLTDHINLAHYGIGDKMGKVLAECLQYLPLIRSINLKDNNLTDDSLQYLIQSIISIPSLRTLNLSRNKIDGLSSEALADFLSRPDCPITSLILQSADIDDGECDNFVRLLVSNKELLELDMSSNLLGSAETLASGDSNIITGGESIALFIKSASCRLKLLNLSWNAIRLNSAIKLSSALAENHTITYLDLSSNGMGWAAGEVLGDSILENRTLKTLLISNNNFSSTACISICVGIAENLAMKHFNMNENPIGPMGTKAVMQLSVDVGSRVKIFSANCNTIALDSRCWYDPSQPCRDYSLHLDKAFDRAVAFHLLRIVASHSTFIFASVTYEKSSSEKQKKKSSQNRKKEDVEEIHLETSLQTDREIYLDEEQKLILQGLRLLKEAASHEELGTELFHVADTDLSGHLDEQELSDVLSRIGLKLNKERIQDLISTFDIDGEGTIDLAEFLNLLRSQYHEAVDRIQDLTQYPVMSLVSQPNVKYVPPRTGVLNMKVVDGFVRKKIYRTVSPTDQKYAYQMAKGIGDLNFMTEAFRNSKMRYEEALAMYRSMFKESGDKIAVLTQILPQMLLPSEARQLTSKVTNDDRVEIGRLKKAFGAALKPIFGSYNGYYQLDLGNELHRTCLVLLIEQSETANTKRAADSIIYHGKIGDTSQHGNWSSFRNEIFNNKKVTITSSMFTPMPKTGSLEFDFSTVSRPNGGELLISDMRIMKVLRNMMLLPNYQREECKQYLKNWQINCAKKDDSKRFFMPTYSFDVQKAKDFGFASDDFYEHLESRRHYAMKGMKKEEIKINFMRRANEMLMEDISNNDEVKQNGPSEIEKGIIPEDIAVEGNINHSTDFEAQANPVEESHVPPELLSFDMTSNDSRDDFESDSRTNSYDSYAAVDTSVVSNQADHPLAQVITEYDSDDNTEQVHNSQHCHIQLKKKAIKESKIRLCALMSSNEKFVSLRAKAMRIAEVAEETFTPIWILSRHLALILLTFKNRFGSLGRTPYHGSYAVDIAVVLFPRVVDLHNIEMIYEILDARECACFFARIGILNLFNPLKPEVTIELSLDRREDRLVTKMIVYLSVAEPGVNLTYKSFQWKRDWDPIPGWEVTEPWMTNEGLPDHGKFIFTYYSGEGKGKLGCSPNLLVRKALTQLTLLDENEVRGENELLLLSPDQKVNTGRNHYHTHLTLWEDYFLSKPSHRIHSE